jgi:hypothetical protein
MFKLVIAGIASAGYSIERQRADSLFYLLDADNGMAFWMSSDSHTDSSGHSIDLVDRG